MWVALWMLAGCRDAGVMQTFPVPDLAFELTSPTYGQFIGDRALMVTGHVGSPEAVVWVEGERATVAEDGTFRARVTVEHPYRIIDVSADLYGQHAEARVPVFDGNDPRLTWPGGLALRLTETGLDGFAAILGATAERVLAPSVIEGLLPPVDLGGTQIAITEVTRDPIAVSLIPTDAGLQASFGMTDLDIVITASGDIFGFPFSVPATITLPRTVIDLGISAGLDEAGAIALTFGDPVVTFDTPEVAIGAVGFGWLSDLLLGWVDIGGLLTDLVDGLVGDLGTLSLGAPIALQTDLLGTSLEIRTNALVTDASGVGLLLGVGLDAPAPTDPAVIPLPPGEFDEPTDLSLAVHEGLLQVLLDSDLLALLDQDIMLPGFLGGFLSNIVRGLPGGDEAPEEAYGWCVGIQPGEAKVARFAEGDVLLTAYLPDATVSFGTFDEGDTSCDDWLVTSLALEVGFRVTEGTKLSFSLAAPEGKVLYYGAEEYDEGALIGQLGGTLTSLLGLLGGITELDLAQILGADAILSGFGLDGTTLALELRGARPMLDPASGAPIDGLWELGVQLFGSAPAAP